MKKYILFTIGFFLAFSASAQLKELPRKPKPGKCYVSCVVPPEYETYSETYPMYIGENADNIELETIQLILEPAQVKWEHQFQWKNGKHQISACPVQYPEASEKIVVVKNPHDSLDLIYETFEILEIIETTETGQKMWEEIDCKLLEFNNLPALFDSQSFVLDKNTKRIIDYYLLDLLQRKRLLTVLINVHTDTYPTAEENLKLSQQRTNEIAKYLEANGINRRRLVMNGFGDAFPYYPYQQQPRFGKVEDADRVEFRVLH